MRLINGILFADGQFVRTSLRTEGGRIAAVGETEQLPGETVYDCKGRYVLPGFVDIHIHAYGGADCMRFRGREPEGRMEVRPAGIAYGMRARKPAGGREGGCAAGRVRKRTLLRVG